MSPFIQENIYLILGFFLIFPLQKPAKDIGVGIKIWIINRFTNKPAFLVGTVCDWIVFPFSGWYIGKCILIKKCLLKCYFRDISGESPGGVFAVSKRVLSTASISIAGFDAEHAERLQYNNPE